MTQIIKKLCCQSQPYFPALLTNSKAHQHIGSWHLSLTALFYISKVIDPLSNGSLIILIYSGAALLHVMKEQSCLAKCIFQSSWEAKSAEDGETHRKEEAVIFVVRMCHHMKPAQNGWTPCTIWVHWICGEVTCWAFGQGPNCYTQCLSVLNNQGCAFLVCKALAEEVKSPNQQATFLLQSWNLSAFLLGRWRSFG